MNVLTHPAVPHQDAESIVGTAEQGVSPVSRPSGGMYPSPVGAAQCLSVSQKKVAHSGGQSRLTLRRDSSADAWTATDFLGTTARTAFKELNIRQPPNHHVNHQDLSAQSALERKEMVVSGTCSGLQGRASQSDPAQHQTHPLAF